MKGRIKFLIVTIVFSLSVLLLSSNHTYAASYNLWNMSTWATVSPGSTGGFVKAVQSNLWATGYQTSTGAIDGIFGSGTASGVRSFQGSEGLTRDAIVGRGTWGAFDKHVIDGAISRVYSHPWSAAYTVYYTVYNQSGGFSYAEGALDRYGVPTGTAFTLWTSGRNLSDSTLETTSPQNIPKFDDSELNIEKHQNLMDKRLTEIENSEFDLVIPKDLPTDKSLVSISKKEFNNGAKLVTTQYGNIDDYSEGKWEITILQENLEGFMTSSEAIDHVKSVIGANKELEGFSIDGNQAFIHINNDGDGFLIPYG